MKKKTETEKHLPWPGSFPAWTSLFVFATFFWMPTPAWAGRVQILGGLDYTALSIDIDSGQGLQRYDRKTGQVFGLELDFSLSNDIELALGANYKVRAYGISQTLYTVNCLEIPVMLRMFLDRVVAIQGGLYGNKALGFMNIGYVPEDKNQPGYTSQVSYDILNMNRVDYGAIIGMHVVTDTTSHFALDLRYLLGLTNAETLSNYDGKYSAFEVILSFTLFGGKGR